MIIWVYIKAQNLTFFLASFSRRSSSFCFSSARMPNFMSADLERFFFFFRRRRSYEESELVEVSVSDDESDLRRRRLFFLL